MRYLNKALTSFRRALAQRGTIHRVSWKPLLCTDDIIEFRIRFHFTPTRKGKNYEAFCAARGRARRTSGIPEEI